MAYNLKSVMGVGITCVIALIADASSFFIGVEILHYEKSPVSPVILAIVIGIFIGNFINFSDEIQNGIKFSGEKILRIGIILLGIRLNFSELTNYGAKAIPLIIVCIITIFMIVKVCIKFLKVSEKMSYLVSIGTGICGATAIIATAPVINAKKEEVTYAVANITIFGIIAMFLYPFLANILFDNDALPIGLFLGTAVHETAQVAASSLIYADNFSNAEVMDIATVTKLTRNTFLVLLIPLIAQVYSHQNNQSHTFSITKIFPYFILGFIGFAVLRSLGDYFIVEQKIDLFNQQTWADVIAIIKTFSELFLIMAMAGIGMLTNFKSLKALGFKPFIVGFIAAASAGLISLGYIFIFIV
jgi:uncharacterized integral membrane protein (TIGR00698 family)